MDADAAAHAVAAGLDPADPDLVVDRRGNRNLVLVDRRRGLVWRFPLWPEDLPGFAAIVQRHRAAQSLGVGAPMVHDAVVDAPLGTAHLVLSYVPGLAMDSPAVAALPPRCLERLGHDLGHVLLRLREIPRDRWPVPGPSWPDLWSGMASRARARVLPMLDPAAREAEERALAAAEAASVVVTTGVVHADVGGVNVRVDPETGALTGILDWDGTHAGDGAVDVAALAAGAPPAVTDAALGVDAVLREDLARHDAYLATWPVQEALWGLETGNDEALADGLRRLNATP